MKTNDQYFVSTRGRAPRAGFAEVLLAGLAPDGGLYLPEAWPQFSPAQIAAFAGRPYGEVARDILARFAAGAFTPDEVAADVAAAYAGFDDPAIAPLVEIGPDLYLLELFHGPTLAFKDIALQVLGRMFARALAKRGGKATVVAATSGDTGSAAIAALGGLPNIEVFVLHPKGRVSEVQRLQMTTSAHANVHNIALEGSFDDAQAIVKALFAETDFARAVNLTAVNSINFARIAAQAVYYFTATAQLGQAATFVVPTGNFGDVFAGEAAMRMGLSVEKLVVATNANDIMVRALTTGSNEVGDLQPSLSPSMDIQVASNFERALFEASGRKGPLDRSADAPFRAHREDRDRSGLRAALRALRCRQRQRRRNAGRRWGTIFDASGRFVDPHTAVALTAALRLGRTAGRWLCSPPPTRPSSRTPSPGPPGAAPPVPERLKGLFSGVERVTVPAQQQGLGPRSYRG
ncbi:MAG: threonine synthase [Rhizomicrobium sp.]